MSKESDLEKSGTILALNELEQEMRYLRTVNIAVFCLFTAWLLFALYVFVRLDALNILTRLL